MRADGPRTSGPLFEGLVHAFPNWLGGFGGDLLRQGRQFLRLFRERFELFAEPGRRELRYAGGSLRRFDTKEAKVLPEELAF